jgi:hypothetical protein
MNNGVIYYAPAFALLDKQQTTKLKIIPIEKIGIPN